MLYFLCHVSPTALMLMQSAFKSLVKAQVRMSTCTLVMFKGIARLAAVLPKFAQT